MSDELIAYLAQRRVGRLIRKDTGNLQFRYDEDYAGPPLSHAMPGARRGRATLARRRAADSLMRWASASASRAGRRMRRWSAYVR